MNLFGFEYHPNRKGKYTSRENLADAMRKYEVKFGTPARYAMMHHDEAKAVREDAPLVVVSQHYMRPGIIYVSHEDGLS